MKNISVTVKAIIGGDLITTISECLTLAKAYGDTLTLEFSNKISLDVRPTSNIHDLFDIYRLKVGSLTP